MKFKINNFDDPKISCWDKSIYIPSDDTFLILDYFKKTITNNSFDGYDIKKVHYLLDMGTGTGIIAIYLQLIASMLKNFKPKIYASDILREAIKCSKNNEKLNNISNKIHYIHSNLFKSFPTKLQNRFNVIIFNPPYLPAIDEIRGQASINKDYSWKGGEEGHEILLDFFNEVMLYLNPEQNSINLIYFITSSRIKKEKITENLNNLGFQTEELLKTHFFFEDIILNRAVRISS